MCPIEIYVNHQRHQHGRLPKHDRALQAFVGAHLLRERELGVDSVRKAAIASGTTPAAVGAARTILQSDDTALGTSALEGRETPARAAGKVVKLVEAFKTATSDDRAALGRVIGPAARCSTPRSCPTFEQRQPDPAHSSGTGRAGPKCAARTRRTAPCL